MPHTKFHGQVQSRPNLGPELAMWQMSSHKKPTKEPRPNGFRAYSC
jgi:hypothetical protein